LKLYLFCFSVSSLTFDPSPCLCLMLRNVCANVMNPSERIVQVNAIGMHPDFVWILIAIGAAERMIKVDEDENAICRNEGNRTSLSLDCICMQIRDGFGLPRCHDM
jgi:hypothetical protein